MSKKIIYTTHLLSRINIRRIPRGLPLQIYKNSDNYYFDIETNLFIAVKAVGRGKNKKKYALAFEVKNDTIFLITIHPIKKNQEENRIRSKRWQKIILKI